MCVHVCDVMIDQAQIPTEALHGESAVVSQFHTGSVFAFGPTVTLMDGCCAKRVYFLDHDRR